MLQEADNPRCEDLDRRCWKGVKVKLASAQAHQDQALGGGVETGYTHCVIFAGCVDLTKYANQTYAKEFAQDQKRAGAAGTGASEGSDDHEGGGEAMNERFVEELQSVVSAICALHILAHEQFGCSTLAVLLPEHSAEVRSKYTIHGCHLQYATILHPPLHS
jgi:hypothetical protein